MTSDEIITAVLLKSGFPTDNYFSNAEMLILMNDEMKLVINPLVMKMQEEFFLQDKDYTISSGASYRLPKRTLGSKVRDVKLYDNGAYVNLNRLYEEDRYKGLQGYYLNRNSLSLSSDITSGTLRVTYFLTPSQLVLASACAQIASIDSATQVTVSALPSTFSLTTPIDIVQAGGQYDLLEIDKTITGIAGTAITFADLPNDLAVGDYICLAGQSPVPVIPVDLHPLLVQAVLCTCLSSKKDKAYEAEMVKLKDQTKAMLEMLDPRVESGDTFIMGQGLLSRIRNR
jgi:hypothetical protein